VARQRHRVIFANPGEKRICLGCTDLSRDEVTVFVNVRNVCSQDVTIQINSKNCDNRVPDLLSYRSFNSDKIEEFCVMINCQEERVREHKLSRSGLYMNANGPAV
jgi:hypothetical protein